jgi:hypothetical protein
MNRENRTIERLIGGWQAQRVKFRELALKVMRRW